MMTSTRDFFVALALKPLLDRTAGRRPPPPGPAARPAPRPRREAPARPRRLFPALALLAVGALAMIVFESTVTRVIGVVCLFAFVVTGVFAIADPRWLGEAPPLEDGR